jgi:protein arginine kinase
MKTAGRTENTVAETDPRGAHDDILNTLPRWLLESGPDDDVVLCTRLSLNRNCQDFCFPPMMEIGEKIELLARSEAAASELDGSHRALELASLEDDRMLMLREQRYLPSPGDADTALTGRRIWMRDDGGGALLLNWDDHFQLQEITAGFETRELYARLEAADSVLEQHYDYAVSLDMGYLRSQIERSGNGLRAEALLHLPALSRDARFDEILAHAQREGLNLSRFGSGSGGSLAQVYMLDLEGALGISEQDMLEKLALVVVEFVHYEREARKSFADSGGLEYLDALWRDYGTLRYCRLLNLRESLDLYSRIRAGSSLGILPESVAGVGLFFLTQPGHLQYLSRMVRTGETGGSRFAAGVGGAKTPDEFRAALFRWALE